MRKKKKKKNLSYYIEKREKKKKTNFPMNYTGFRKKNSPLHSDLTAAKPMQRKGIPGITFIGKWRCPRVRNPIIQETRDNIPVDLTADVSEEDGS